MSKLKISDLFKPDREHYIMDKNKLSKIDCNTCKIIYDYTKICPHQTDATSNQLESWNELQEQMKVETKDSNI